MNIKDWHKGLVVTDCLLGVNFNYRWDAKVPTFNASSFTAKQDFSALFLGCLDGLVEEVNGCRAVNGTAKDSLLEWASDWNLGVCGKQALKELFVDIFVDELKAKIIIYKHWQK